MQHHRNIIFWAHQATVDHNYRIPSLGSLAKDILGKHKEWLKENADLEVTNKLASDRSETLFGILEQIQEHGLSLSRDIKKDITSYTDSAKFLKTIRDDLDALRTPCQVEIGGDPAIAALRGYHLRQGREDTDLPLVFYAGLFPASVREAIRQNSDLRVWNDVIRLKKEIEEEPQSVGLEAQEHKLVLIHSPGRSIADLAPKGDFDEFLNTVGSVMAANPEALGVLAVGAGKPKAIGLAASDGTHYESEMDMLSAMILKVKGHDDYGKRIRIFVATRVFGNDKAFRESVSKLLAHADIISMNDSEVEALHTVAHGGAWESRPLAAKLRELPFKAIKVCHSADGVIMDLGCVPERIITSRKFRDSPSDYLQEVLRLSADGATYAMDATAGLGRTANESMIRIYSKNIVDETRQQDLFNRTFRSVREPMPAGMLSIASARVVRPLGAVVGLGAIFDSLLVSFLMRS